MLEERQFRAYCMHELRMPSDKEIQIQTLGLMCREMTVWKDMGGGGHLQSLLHTYFYFYMDKIYLRLLESSSSTSTEG